MAKWLRYKQWEISRQQYARTIYRYQVAKMEGCLCNNYHADLDDVLVFQLLE